MNAGSLWYRFRTYDDNGVLARVEAHGGATNETYAGSANGDSLSGGGGDDVLNALAGNDTLNGGTGNDLLKGGAGKDSYLFGRGDGVDIVDDTGELSSGDTIDFDSSVSTNDIVATRDANNLYLTNEQSGDRITLLNWWTASGRITSVTFSDGTVWGEDALGQAKFNGTAGDDRLVGGNLGEEINGLDGADILIGGGGDDILSGGGGDDIYVYAAGDGSDTIMATQVGGGQDLLRFGAGVAAGDIVLTRDFYNLYVSLPSSGDKITLQMWFGMDGAGDGADRVTSMEFADGTRWDLQTILAAANKPTEGADLLVGTGGADTLRGLGGNDAIYGMGGNDTFIGGAGDDALIGGAGDDVFIFDRGDGIDYIDNWSQNAGEHDRIRFAPGIKPSDVQFSSSGFDLLLALPSGGQVTVSNFFAGASDGNGKAGTLEFDDGTVWGVNDIIGLVPPAVATDGNDQLTVIKPAVVDALAGDDTVQGVAGSTLYGGVGNDVLMVVNGPGNAVGLHGGDGNDQLTITAGSNSELYGDAGDDRLTVTGQLYGTNLLLDGGDGEDSLYVQAANASILRGGAGNDNLILSNGSGSTLDGGDGNDTVQLFHGDNDTLQGGAGNDVLSSFGGYAVELYGGDGDDTLSGNGDGMKLYGGQGGDHLTFGNGDNVVMDGGDDADTLQFGGGNGNTLIGGSGDDHVSIGGGNGNSLDGGLGADWLNVGGGNHDTITGGEGNDQLIHSVGSNNILDGGDGDDTIQFNNGGNDNHLIGGAGDDQLTFGGGGRNLVDMGSGNDIATVNGYGATVILGREGMDQLNLNYGTALIDGGADNDHIRVGTGSQIVAGGAGDDEIMAIGSGDIVVLNKGDGKDRLSAAQSTGATLSLGGGILYSDLLLSRNADDLILTTGVGDGITLADWFSDDEVRSISTLQIFTAGDYDSASADPLNNQRVESFDFAGLASAFEQAAAGNHFYSNWSVSQALLNAHLGGSNDSALGGELALAYAKNGSTSSLQLDAIQSVLSEEGFGTTAQRLKA